MTANMPRVLGWHPVPEWGLQSTSLNLSTPCSPELVDLEVAEAKLLQTLLLPHMHPLNTTNNLL